MITITGLKKRFGKLEVLKGIDLTIDKGKITAIVGPNGSGKSTLIKSILGLVKAQEGTISVDDFEINGDSSYRRNIGYMPQKARFPDNLTVADILKMLRDIRKDAMETDKELFECFGLNEVLGKPLRTLSGGTTQRVSAAIAFLFNPGVLILDEPTAGLDPISSSRLKDKILREKGRGKTIILTSHIMSEIEELAERIIFLLEGKIHFEGDLKEILAGSNEFRLERVIAEIMKGNAA